MRVPWQILVTASFVAACATAVGQEPEVRLCEPWDSEYVDRDATGDHVLALWQFNAGSETADTSGGGHELVLEDAAVSPAGRFGSALETFRGWPVADERHRARAKDSDALSPPGAFTDAL